MTGDASLKSWHVRSNGEEGNEMTENLKIKTIKIELMEGTPEGFRRAEFTTQLMRVLVVPRDRQDLLEHCPEAKFQAVYLIVGEDEQGTPTVYVGKTRRMALRLKEHGKGGRKDYWKNVLYFVTKDNSLSSTEIEYLEWMLIRKATEAGNYQLDNGNKGCREEPRVEVAERSDFADYYNQIVALTEVLGYGGIFNRIQTENAGQEEVYHCESAKGGVSARLIARNDGFYVLAGSVCAMNLSESGRKNAALVHQRERLRNTGVLKRQDGKLLFAQDYKFQSPSGAATLIYGRNMNGWETWRSASGKTLDECLRRNDPQ